MDSSKPELAEEIFPYVRVYKDGTIERLAGTEIAQPGFDPQTGVSSKDVVVVPESGVSARLYRPNLSCSSNGGRLKLPLVIYFHGGAYIISSISDPKYHNSLNRLVAEANIVLISVDYRRAPEHPLPTAFDDSRAVIQWVVSHATGEGGSEAWLNDDVDFRRLFFAGDSAGANISHHMAMEKAAGIINPTGMIMIFPYFWGEIPIGSEATDPVRKSMVDKWWKFVCPSDKGSDDPLINPFVYGAPSLVGLGCDNVIVIVAEKDILSDRGSLYYESLVKSEWRGRVEMVEIQGEEHVFHIFKPDSEKAITMIKTITDFIHQKTVNVVG